MSENQVRFMDELMAEHSNIFNLMKQTKDEKAIKTLNNKLNMINKLITNINNYNCLKNNEKNKVK